MSLRLEAGSVEGGTTTLATRRRTAVAGLAGIESRRLIRHPIFIAGVTLSAVVLVLATRNWAPVLHRDDIIVAGSLLPLAGATMVVANLATLRSRRHGTDELFDSTATDGSPRTLAHFLSLGAALAVALVFEGGALLYLLVLDPVGMPRAFELLAGPGVVLLAGSVGVFLARWWPSVAAGPLALVALAGTELLFNLFLGKQPVGDSSLRWLAPWVSLTSQDSNPPPELVVRHAGWHLLYLVALAALVGLTAVLRIRTRPRIVSSALIALAFVAGSAWAQTLPSTSQQVQHLVAMVERPERFQVCEAAAGVRYCAYPAYTAWIDRWQSIVGPVMSALPPQGRPQGLVVQQTFRFDLPGTPVSHLATSELGLGEGRAVFNPNGPAVLVTHRWARSQPTFDFDSRRLGEDDHQMAITLGIAAWALGVVEPWEAIVLTEEDAGRILATIAPEDRASAERDVRAGAQWGSCSTADQARAAVALWLAAQATPQTENVLRRRVEAEPHVFRDEETVAYFGSPFYVDLGGGPYWHATGDVAIWTRPEAEYAVQLLDRPKAEVLGTLWDNWEHLTDPSTPTQELIELFGLRPIPSVEERAQRLGFSLDEIRREIAYSQAVACR